MTRPTFASFCTLVGGWIFAARHHVTGALRAACDPGGRSTPKHFSAYHRVFAAARWSLDAVGLALLGLILATALAGGATVWLVIDDTLCAKVGRRMFGVDSHYDAANTGRRRSNANQSLKRRGHCWVILGVLLPVPWGTGHVCLPLLFRLYLNHAGARRHRRAYRPRPQLARELLARVCSAHPQQHFHVLLDSAYAGQDTLKQLPGNCDLTARWQMNVRLCGPAPTQRRPGQHGPLSTRGPRLPSPRQMLAELGPSLELPRYGRRHRLRVAATRLRVASCLGCLYTVPGRLLRLVASEPLRASGKPRHAAFYYSTDVTADAVQVLQNYAWRWTIEVSIHDAKQQLGFAQPQGWTALAVQRTTPSLMLLYSVVVLWFAREGHRSYRRRAWPWYRHKTAISFADILCTLRENLLRQHLKQDPSNPVKKQGYRDPLHILLRLARLAA